MKIISAIWCCLFIGNISFAQINKGAKWVKGKEYYHKIFPDNDPIFNETKSPVEFQSSPVVILGQKKYFTFQPNWLLPQKLVDPNYIGNKFVQIIRRRIKIQEATAIADFSEFYFTDALSFGIKLIKPDGTVQELDVRNAVSVTTKVPKFYKDLYQGEEYYNCLLYTSPSPRDATLSRMPSSAWKKK